LQRILVAALKDEAHLTKSVRLNEAGKRFLTAALDEAGLRHYPTQANFIYLDTGREGRSVYEALLREGVIVRHIMGNWLRVSIGRPAENRRFVKSLKKVIGKRG